MNTVQQETHARPFASPAGVACRPKRRGRPNAKRVDRIPSDVPVFAIAPAGRGRWRWAVWSERAHVDNGDGEIGLAHTLAKREASAGGFAYSEAEANELVTKTSLRALRVASHYAMPAHLRTYGERDRIIADAARAGESPEKYARRVDSAREASYRASEARRISATVAAPQPIGDVACRAAARDAIALASERAMALLGSSRHSITAKAGLVVAFADLALREEDAELLDAYRAALIGARDGLCAKRAADRAPARAEIARAQTSANVVDIMEWLKRKSGTEEQTDRSLQ